MQTLTLPKRVVEHVLEASKTLAVLQDELEDYFVARHPALLKKLYQARREHLAGKTHPFVYPPAKHE